MKRYRIQKTGNDSVMFKPLTGPENHSGLEGSEFTLNDCPEYLDRSSSQVVEYGPEGETPELDPSITKRAFMRGLGVSAAGVVGTSFMGSATAAEDKDYTDISYAELVNDKENFIGEPVTLEARPEYVESRLEGFVMGQDEIVNVDAAERIFRIYGDSSDQVLTGYTKGAVNVPDEVAGYEVDLPIVEEFDSEVDQLENSVNGSELLEISGMLTENETVLEKSEPDERLRFKIEDAKSL